MSVEEQVRIPAGDAELDGDLSVPDGAPGIVVFAHGSGSSRQSPRNRDVAAVLRDAGLGTLLMDLLTPDEEEVDVRTRALRFDIDLLADRTVAAVDWAAATTQRVGCFGASTGAAAALVAAARRPGSVRAVVSRGGRPDLAGPALGAVRAPTLLIVGGDDHEVLALNRRAMAVMAADVVLELVDGAGHLFAEPGALEQVATLAAGFLAGHLGGGADA